MRNSGEWKNWRLLAKLDPDKKITEEILEIINHSNIDAVVVGGTQGITWEKTFDLVSSVRRSGYERPLVQEISSEDVVVPGVDAYFLPVVLNAADKKWLVDTHLNAIKRYGSLIPWGKVLTEGYLVCNGNSAVGQLTGASEMSIEDAVAYVALAEKIYSIPLLYIEYSGVFGNLELVKAVAGAREKIHIFYGGGIQTADQLCSVAKWVDTVVIGNIFYDNLSQAREVVCSIN